MALIPQTLGHPEIAHLLGEPQGKRNMSSTTHSSLKAYILKVKFCSLLRSKPSLDKWS